MSISRLYELALQTPDSLSDTLFWTSMATISMHLCCLLLFFVVVQSISLYEALDPHDRVGSCCPPENIVDSSLVYLALGVIF